MSRKKKIRIVVSVMLSILIFIGIGGYIWYVNSPFSTITKLMSAAKKKDVDKVLECIEPETAQKFQLIMNFTGISSDDLIDTITRSESDKETDNNPITESASIKFSDYSRDGDQAYLTLTAIGEDGEEKKKEIQFVRVNHIWYLSLGMNEKSAKMSQPAN